jgi:aminodeoxyfutalosine deaminase
MTTHLHVHLEPNERERRRRGRKAPAYGSAEQLFAEHRPGNPDRLPVGLADLESFIREFHAEQRDQAVRYAELRLSPRRFRSLGFSLPDILAAADRAASPLAGPEVRLIMLLNRDSSPEYVEECEDALLSGLPRTFVGVDLAGDEVRLADVARFKRFFHRARLGGLGVTVHAGEFGGADSIWQAIDELGAERIGHGTSAAGCDALAARLRADRILLEISVTSNVALKAVPALESHPLPWFTEKGILVCLNTDVPLHLGTDMGQEQRAALRVTDGGQSALESMEAAARGKSFRDRNAGSAP